MASNAYSVPINEQLASTQWVMNAPPNIILPRDPSGKPGPQYPPNQPPHLDHAINICRGIIDHADGRKAYERFATRFSIDQPNSWYLQGSSRMTMNKVSKTFIEAILVKFPVVIIDYALRNPDYKGFHTRRPYKGDFNPAHQAISINGNMIDQMSIAYDRTVENPADQGRQHTFRAFMFKTANTIFHEMAHVFVTYLTKGQSLTPPRLNDPTVKISESGGEAGRNMEVLLFGGTINHFHQPPSGKPSSGGFTSEGSASKEPTSTGPASGNPADGIPTNETLVYQCGTAYLKKWSGGIYRILPKAIDDTVTFLFKFPYEHEESSEGGELTRLGEGFAPDIYTDPLERPELAHLLK